MPCMNVKMTRVGGMIATATRSGGMNATATRVGEMSARMALVCGTSIGLKYELLWVTDGAYITTADGEYVVVQRQN